jgi:integrase
MNYVEPIRDAHILKMIANDSKSGNSQRNYMLFMCGIYLGRRIMDTLKLQVKDLKDKDFVHVRESKTGKKVLLPISKTLKKELSGYMKDMSPDEYLFKSSQKKYKPIDRTTCSKIIKAAVQKYGLENINCHSLRKTFGYHYYKQTGDIVTLMDIFGIRTLVLH